MNSIVINFIFVLLVERGLGSGGKLFLPVLNDKENGGCILDKEVATKYI